MGGVKKLVRGSKNSMGNFQKSKMGLHPNLRKLHTKLVEKQLKVLTINSLVDIEFCMFTSTSYCLLHPGRPHNEKSYYPSLSTTEHYL